MLKILNDYAQGKVIQKHNKKLTLTKNLKKTAVTLCFPSHIAVIKNENSPKNSMDLNERYT